MTYLNFYDLRTYVNEAWRGKFSEREIAEQAYEDMLVYNMSLECRKLTPCMKGLCECLEEDGSEECLHWKKMIEEHSK